MNLSKNWRKMNKELKRGAHYTNDNNQTSDTKAPNAYVQMKQ